MNLVKVLVVTTSFPLRSSSSSGVFVKRLVEAFPLSISATVMCPDDNSDEQGVDSPNCVVKAIRYGPKNWQLLAQQPGGIVAALRARPALFILLPLLLTSMIWQVRREAKHHDVIHANWAICGTIAKLSLILRKNGVVLTLRGDDVTLAKRSRVQMLLLRLAVNRAERIVCVAETMFDAIKKDFPKICQRTCVVLNGVGKEFLEVTPPRFRTGRQLELLAVGSLIKRKGYDLLLQALALSRLTAYRLTVIGDGSERESLENLSIELDIAAQVRFVGAIEPSTIPSYFATSDLFVFPSRSEGRPNVVIEAMAAACPVVAFAIPGVVDLIESGKEGWLVEPGNVAQFASALVDASGGVSERSKRGRLGRERVTNSGWTWEAAGKKYAAIFEDIVNRKQVGIGSCAE